MKPKYTNWIWLACGVAACASGQQGTAATVVTTLDAMVVTAEAESDHTNQKGWLPEVVGTAVYAGKKTAVIDTDGQAQIVNNNYRQALSQTPSLLLAEESTPLVSIGYRGLNPHRAQFTQVLRDGIPIHADQMGYPEAYYTPPLDTVDRIEFLHGGAALQHGPQPGGSLNYITHRPRTDKPFSFRSLQIIGSDDLYTTFNSADGTIDRLGYYIYQNHREGDGFRSANSDFSLDTAAVKLLYTFENGATLIFNADTYHEDHGEPGGLTQADFNQGSLNATRLHDRFALDRDSVSLTYEMTPSTESFFTTSAWWTDYTRYSRRQGGGGFGTLPTGAAAATNTIEEQNMRTLGLDSRYRLNWGTDAKHTFSAGLQLYHVDSPRADSKGASADASTGQLRRASDREVFYAPIFVENKFQFGNFSITPGLRLENIQQSVDETVNLDKPNLAHKTFTDHIPLLGLGLEYKTTEKSTVYSNLSQAYRPRIFTEAVPLGNGQIINSDLEEGKALEYELGYRTRPHDWLTLDASLFMLAFKDQIGQVTHGSVTSFENVGDSLHQGIDLSVNVDLLECFAETKKYGKLEWYTNTTLLDAQFTSGPNDGKTPQYAPDFMMRTGFNYSMDDQWKITLGSTFLSEHYANDNNSETFKIPAYMVWDLTAEWKVHQNVRLVAGINNLFDESYYARVRADGIDPGNGRNYYLGASFEF